MYKDAEAEIARIAEIAAKCPADLKVKCFEVLLNGYVQSELEKNKPPTSARGARELEREKTGGGEAASTVPSAALPRFQSLAKRTGISLAKLESLFDFNVDPFVLHAVTLPTGNAAQKARNVVLLVATRSHLATGGWSADWKEVISQCVAYNCYSQNNHVTNLEKGEGSTFVSIEAKKPIELSAAGIQEAEKLLKTLTESPAA
jgi:hypothetical protein